MKKIIYADDLMLAIRDDPTIRGTAYAAVMQHIHNAPAVEAEPVGNGGADNGETPELLYGSSPCTHLPRRKVVEE